MLRIRSLQVSFLTAAVLLLSSPFLANAQVAPDPNPGSSVQTRAELLGLLDYYEQIVQSPAYSGQVKERATVSAERIRERLEEGDFRLGDRVVLSVEGEPGLPDTVSVQAGPKITLPMFGEISLDGVLRSEVADRIAEALGQFIRDPTVRAQGLMRVSVQGAVAQPGFYLMPADMLLSEALMVAGGPAPTAKLDDLRIERGVEVVVAGNELQEAMRRGLTLDQLNLQAGDQVMLPQQGPGFFSNIGVIVGIVSTLTFAIVQLAR